MNYQRYTHGEARIAQILEAFPTIFIDFKSVFVTADRLKMINVLEELKLLKKLKELSRMSLENIKTKVRF